MSELGSCLALSGCVTLAIGEVLTQTLFALDRGRKLSSHSRQLRFAGIYCPLITHRFVSHFPLFRPVFPLRRYVALIVGRAMGDVPTGATWQRNFVRSHPEYQGDSVVTPRIAHDLLAKIERVATGKEAAPDLLGSFSRPPVAFDARTLEMLRKDEAAGAGGHGGASVILHLTPQEAHHAHPLLPTPAAEGSGDGSATAGGSGSAGSGEGVVVVVSEEQSPDHALPHLTQLPASAVDTRGEAPRLRVVTGGDMGVGASVPSDAVVVPALVAYPHYRPQASTSTGATARMRGASFAEEGEVVYECAALRAIVESYRGRYGLEPGGRRLVAAHSGGLGQGSLPSSPAMRGMAAPPVVGGAGGGGGGGGGRGTVM